MDRGNRQQEVIEAAISQALKINNVTKYQEILDSVSDNVNTNFKFEDLVSLAGNMLSGFTIDKHTYEWYDGESYDGQSIVYIQDYSYNEIRNDMLKALGRSDEMTPENQGRLRRQVPTINEVMFFYNRIIKRNAAAFLFLKGPFLAVVCNKFIDL